MTAFIPHAVLSAWLHTHRSDALAVLARKLGAKCEYRTDFNPDGKGKCFVVVCGKIMTKEELGEYSNFFASRASWVSTDGKVWG